MDKLQAERILGCLVAGQASLSDAVEEIERLGRTEEAESLRRTLATAIGTVAALAGSRH